MQIKKADASKYLWVFKFFIFVVAVYTLGVPIIEPWKAVTLFVFVVFLVYANNFKLSKFSWLVAGSIILLLLIKCFIPAINIQEGHNYFVPKGQEKKVTYNALPKNILRELNRDFLRYYPRASWCDKNIYGCWRHTNPSVIPYNNFAFSADGFWQSPKYSRIVHGVKFSSLKTFRGGFVNDLSKNWYANRSDVKRTNMPFFVMYEIPHSLVGAQFCWCGKIFWQQPNGKFKSMFTRNRVCRKISSSDIGKKIFGISFPGKNDLSIHVIPGWQMLAMHYFENILAALVLILLLSFFRVRWKNAGIFLLWSALALIILAFRKLHSHMLFHFNILEGGCDGLTYQGMGRIMLYYLQHGNFIKMLEGTEAVFYYMPGMRYFVMLAKLIFGDSDLGLFLVVLSYFGIVGELLRKLFGSIKMSLFVFIFLMLSYFGKKIFFLAVGGMSETVGVVLVLLGIIQLFNYGDNRNLIKSAWLAGLFFGLAVIIRPNFLIMVSFGLLFAAFDLLKQGKLLKIIIMYSGFLVLLLVPLHNLIFGHRFVPLTSSAFISANHSVSLIDYYYAIINLFTHGHVDVYARVAVHLHNWLGLFRVLPLLLLPIIFIYIKDFKIRLLTFMALGAHIVLMFWAAYDFRYAYLAWFLTTIVIIAAIIRIFPWGGLFTRQTRTHSR